MIFKRALFSKPIQLLIAIMLVMLILADKSAAGTTSPNVILAADGHAVAASISYLFMKETSTLRVDGSGEEYLEFNVQNSGSSYIDSAGVWITTPTAEYSNVRTWDDAGQIGHSLVVDGNTIQISIHFRSSVAPGDTYHYFMAIDLGNIAAYQGDQWQFGWRTEFPASQFVRVVELPPGSNILSVSPAPDSQEPTRIEWLRTNLSSITVYVDYITRELTEQELANKFSPHFRMHPSDGYVPMNVDLALQHAIEIKDYGSDDHETGPLTTDDLTTLRWINNEKAYINLKGDPGGGLDPGSSHNYYLNNLQSQANADPVVYARVDPSDPDVIVIQYWLYYFYNSWGLDSIGGLNVHEGDWEMVQVILDRDQVPLYAAYSQHASYELLFFEIGDGGTKKEWNDLDRDGTHPIVYPGHGSHASYFGPYPYLLNFDKTAGLNTSLLKPRVYLLQPGSTDNWVNFRGHWGEKRFKVLPKVINDGPQSPGGQNQKWVDPAGWSRNSIPWDEVAAHHKGKVRSTAPAPCNTLIYDWIDGKFYGWFFDEFYGDIESGEYVVNESTENRTVIIHNSVGIDHLRYKVYWSCGPFLIPSLAGSAAETTIASLEFVGPDGTDLIQLAYELQNNWTEDSYAFVDLSGSDDYLANIDLDGDGTVDLTEDPISNERVPVKKPRLAGGVVYLPAIYR